jgi:quercetin dioxygenase-like cupin family protein
MKNDKMQKHPRPIQITRWASVDENGKISIISGQREIKMCNSDGTATPLLKEGTFGADIIRFGPNEGVENHTHPGAHMLFTIKGHGVVEYEGISYPLEPGVCYLIPSQVEHAIKAGTELVLLAIGNDHRPAGSLERMNLVHSYK